jgi:hypothetical protein
VGSITTAVKQKIAIASAFGERKFSNVAAQDYKKLNQWNLAAQTQAPAGVTAAASNSGQVAQTAVTPPPQQGSFSFRASGTNLSLKQTVVIEGVYLVTPLPGEAQAKTVAKAAQNAATAKRAELKDQAAGEQSNGVIQGQAQIGSGQTVEINAIAISSTGGDAVK